MIGSLLPCGSGRPSQSGQSGQPSPDSVTRTMPPTATSAHAASAAASAASRKPTVGTRIAAIEQPRSARPLIKIDQDRGLVGSDTPDKAPGEESAREHRDAVRRAGPARASRARRRAGADGLRRVDPRQPPGLDGDRGRDLVPLPRLGDARDPQPLPRRHPQGVAVTSAPESPVASPAPGWARRLPRDERVFLWLVLASAAVMSAFVIGWLIWGKQNVPSTYRYVSTKDFAAQVTRFAQQHRGADGRVYVPPGSDGYLLAARFSWFPHLVLQAHTRYRIWMSAADVLHGFSLVGGTVNYNLELAPNHASGVSITVGAPGRYLIVCNELCGLRHEAMRGFIDVVTPAAMQKALAGEATATPASPATTAGPLMLTGDPKGLLRFDRSVLEAEAGTVTIVMKNPSPVPHNVAIKVNGVDVKGAVVTAGGTSTVRAKLAAGTYVFYCSVP